MRTALILRTALRCAATLSHKMSSCSSSSTTSSSPLHATADILFHSSGAASSSSGSVADASPSATSKPRVIFVVGTTGSGKTRLAVDLASSLNGEVINSDSIQMYQGLDIASAKATEEEKKGVPHHLFSFLLPRHAFSVRQYRSVAHAAITDVVSRGKTPIIVGGTMYYVQALLREGGILYEHEEVAAEDGRAGASGGAVTAAAVGAVVEEAWPAAAGASSSSSAPSTSASSSTISPYQRLQTVDPVMAGRLHPNDARKIARALEVFDNTGVPYSEVISRQSIRIEDLSGPYQCKVFWLQVNKTEVLDERLDKRVDQMLSRGLLREQWALRQYLTATEVEKGGADDDALASASLLAVDTPSDLTTMIVSEFLAAERVSPSSSSSSDGAGDASNVTKREPSAPSSSSSSITMPSAASAASAEAAALEREHVGLLAAIGFKEFDDFWKMAGESGVDAVPPLVSSLPRHGGGAPSTKKQKKQTQEGAKEQALAWAVKRLCEVTHKYARKQDRWIRNRFAARGVRMTVLDTSDCSSGSGRGGGGGADVWLDSVSKPAIEEAQRWLAGEEEGDDSAAAAADGTSFSNSSNASTMVGLVPSAPESSRISQWKQHICAVCGDKLLNGDREWEAHLTSRGHKRATWRKEAETKGFFKGRGMTKREEGEGEEKAERAGGEKGKDAGSRKRKGSDAEEI